jgi:anti-sigma regulatory factor (Ser/Thr protein kinase)/ribosomal protein S18 acetylase RimI-like enzyme
MNISKCEYSAIRIPNDPKYATAAAIYVSEIARMIGVDDQGLKSVENGVIEAITALMEYSFEPGEKSTLEISCERIAEGLKISLKDKGLPFGMADTPLLDAENPLDAPSGLEEPIFRLKEYLDEIRFHNLGPEGKEIVLIKHLKNKNITDYFDACELEPYEPLKPEIDTAAAKMKCQVRRMRPNEAAEVSKTVYKAYGYTYPHDYVYYPERIVALNESEQIHSAVAVAGESEIAGYGVLQTWEENPQIAELAQGVVKPEFRSRGCFGQMTDYLIKRANTKGLLGLFGEAVTNHTVSQHTAHRFGFKDCALRLGMIPMNTTFKGMNGTISQRGSMLVQFMYLKKVSAESLLLYAPPHHRDILLSVYSEFDTTPKITTAQPNIATSDTASVFKIKLVGSMSFARIIITRYGNSIVRELKTRVRELCLKKIEIVNLYLNLSDPLTSYYAAEFEKLGFFFAGILPGGIANGDALILQYLNSVTIDYEAVHVKSSIAKKLLAYIKKHDPNLS